MVGARAAQEAGGTASGSAAEGALADQGAAGARGRGQETWQIGLREGLGGRLRPHARARGCPRQPHRLRPRGGQGRAAVWPCGALSRCRACRGGGGRRREPGAAGPRRTPVGGGGGGVSPFGRRRCRGGRRTVSRGAVGREPDAPLLGRRWRADLPGRGASRAQGLGGTPGAGGGRGVAVPRRSGRCAAERRAGALRDVQIPGLRQEQEGIPDLEHW
mmetsp:Transcript_73281/g.231428  ORF Transcript_73281/g.231428 Transcript_73281/m.231428 type:complete len:217 (+) Transcript_73281:532-1182(+)